MLNEIIEMVIGWFQNNENLHNENESNRVYGVRRDDQGRLYEDTTYGRRYI